MNNEELINLRGGYYGSNNDKCETTCYNGKTIGKACDGDCHITKGVEVRCLSNVGARFTKWSSSCR